MADETETTSIPRREPPPWIPVTVAAREALSPHMVRLTFTGVGLGSMETPTVASSIRLLVPAGDTALVIPEWNGNEFLLPSGERPDIRTFTPLRFDPRATTIDVDVVLHEGGAVSEWAERVSVGEPAAISGPGRGYEPDLTAARYLIFGDESALPAIGQLLDALNQPRGANLTDHGAGTPVPCEVHLEVSSPDAELPMPPHPSVELTWHVRDPDSAPGHTLVDAAESIDATGDGTQVWAAGEAAAMQALRKHFTGRLGLPRSHATIRGYWKVGR